MHKPVALLLILQLLSACQTTESGLLTSSASKDRTATMDALNDPTATGSIASDLAMEVKAFVPEGSTILLSSEAPAGLSAAVNDALLRQGYSLDGEAKTGTGAIRLGLWAIVVDDTILVRVSMPSHRLAKVYRQAARRQATEGEMAGESLFAPAGPLVVETRQAGPAS